MLLKTRRDTTVIGVELGACSLRAVQLRRGAGGWHVAHWVNVEAELVAPAPRPPHDQEELKLAFGPGTFEGTRVSISLSPPQVEYHLIELPEAILHHGPAQLRTALDIELGRQMPWPISESEVCTWPVAPGKGVKVPAMVVAAHRPPLQSWLDQLLDCGLECMRVDVTPNAMISLRQAGLNGSHELSTDTVWGVLDIGHTSSRLYVAHGDFPVYARVMRHGGKAMTERLAEALRVDFAIAERYKRIYGIEVTERGFRTMLGGLNRITEEDLPSVLYAILRPLLDEMVAEIERSYRYATGQLGHVQAGPIFLTGGGARMKGLVGLLGDRLGVPVCLPDPATLFSEAASDGPDRPVVFRPGTYTVLAPCAGMALMGVRT